MRNEGIQESQIDKAFHLVEYSECLAPVILKWLCPKLTTITVAKMQRCLNKRLIAMSKIVDPSILPTGCLATGPLPLPPPLNLPQLN